MPSTKKALIGPSAAFAGFALLIAARDIAAELYLAEDAVSLAFFVCGTIALLAFINISLFSGIRGFLAKLADTRICWMSIALGMMGAIIYAGSFFLISRIGAGVFNLVNYGLMPLVTTMIGVNMFSERLPSRFFYLLPLPRGSGATQQLPVHEWPQICVYCDDYPNH